MSADNLLWFVTWPDGAVMDASPATSRDGAAANAVNHFLPVEWFKHLEMGRVWGGGALYYLWPSMERAGFKLQSLPIPRTALPDPEARS